MKASSFACPTCQGQAVDIDRDYDVGPREDDSCLDTGLSHVQFQFVEGSCQEGHHFVMGWERNEDGKVVYGVRAVAR